MPIFVIRMANRWPEDQSHNFSTLESKLWRNAGPSVFQLQKAMLKSSKVHCVSKKHPWHFRL